jgi:hypothetical protein
LSIPSGVTSIALFAFKGCTSLRNVSIPGSVTSIGYGAFHSVSRTRICTYALARVPKLYAKCRLTAKEYLRRSAPGRAENTQLGRWGTPLKEAIHNKRDECAAVLRAAGAKNRFWW